MSDLVSIIMSIYNEPVEWLKKSIYSILNQTYENIEFIIVCDNPKSQRIISFVEEEILPDKRVIFLINDENKGLIFSLNRALSIAQGDYIVRMDADDISFLDRLEKQKRYLEENNLDLIGTNVQLFSDQGELSITNKPLSHSNIEYMLKVGTPAIVHPTFFAKREVFDNTKGYNIKAYHAEDMEFLAHVLSLGYKVGNMKEVLLKVRFSYDSVTKNNAYIMFLTSMLVKKMYLNYLKSGKYVFEGISIEGINEKKLVKFKKKQIALTEARNYLKKRNISLFLLEIIKAFYYAPYAILNTLRVNLVLKYIQYLEKEK